LINTPIPSDDVIQHEDEDEGEDVNKDISQLPKDPNYYNEVDFEDLFE
jgi:hypothetical protein